MIQINQILNDTYRIEEQLGSGGGGIVFKAYHLRLEKYVAVKLIKDNVKDIINQRGEADILKRLKHEGLPQVYDFINDGEDIYTVMEFIDGGSLFDEIVKRKKIPYKKSLEWAKQLCEAAAYLHTRKPQIIHSDIKPQNIMITSEGKLCLIDFNISSVFGGGIYTVGSSDGYSPPEQYIVKPDRWTRQRDTAQSDDATEILDDDRTELLTSDTGTTDSDKTELVSYDDDKTELLSEVQPSNYKTEEKHITDSTIIDASSDVYSIGAVMYSMITGMKPNNSRKIVVPIKKIDENIPDALAHIIEKAMSSEKEKRFSSAVEMLKALNNINKLDKRYKRMALGQQLAYIFCVALLAGSVFSIISGYRLMQVESEDRLTEYISQLNDLSVSGDYSDFELIFSEVTDKYPDSLEPHYYKALMLYSDGNYDQAQEYIDENLLDRLSELPEGIRSDAYYLKADILSRQENYSEAVEYYRSAVALNTESADIYRDYAIALARSGDIENAENIMQLAMERGLSEDGVYMVTGEIQFMRNEFPEAVDSLKSGIAISDNNTLKRNAYLLCSRAYKEQYTAESKDIMLENIALLEGALLDIPQEMTMQIREYLAQAYIDYGEISRTKDYFAKAITLLEEMKPFGWSNYRTEMNIAVLYDRMEMPDSCKRVLLEMADKPDYELYLFTIYTRLAYCEADIQGQADIDQRDYSEFDSYYSAAAEAYKKYTENGNSDPEMDRLTQLRNEMVSLGWLD